MWRNNNYRVDISSRWAAACDLRGGRLHHLHRLHRRDADNNSTDNSGERTSAGLRAPLGLQNKRNGR